MNKSKAVDLLKVIGLKFFPTSTSSYGFSPTNLAKILNVTRVTLLNWLSSKTELNEKQINSIKNSLMMNGYIDDDWNIQDNPSNKSLNDVLKENEELRTKYENISKTVPEIKDKLIEIQSNLIESTNDNVDLRLEIERLKSILDKNKFKY